MMRLIRCLTVLGKVGVGLFGVSGSAGVILTLWAGITDNREIILSLEPQLVVTLWIFNISVFTITALFAYLIHVQRVSELESLNAIVRWLTSSHPGVTLVAFWATQGYLAAIEMVYIAGRLIT